MTGEELKQTVKRSGMSVTDFARELNMTPQNLNSKFGQKSIKTDLMSRVYAIINRCSPPLHDEMESAVFGQSITGNNNTGNINTVGGSASEAALRKENEMLREQNEYLRKQNDRLLAILEK